MSGMVLVTSAGTICEKVFCVRPCGVLARRNQRAQVGMGSFLPSPEPVDSAPPHPASLP